MPKKQGRPSLPENKKRKKYVKVWLNEDEFQMYQSARERLLSSSPALSPHQKKSKVQDLFRTLLLNIDDLAFQEFIDLPSDHDIKVFLRSQALFGGLL